MLEAVEGVEVDAGEDLLVDHVVEQDRGLVGIERGRLGRLGLAGHDTAPWAAAVVAGDGVTAARRACLIS